MLLDALVTYFKERSAVTALVGDRIFTTALKQGVPTPAVDCRIVRTTHHHHLNGLAGIATSLVTFDCYSDLATAQADEVANAMMYSGIVGFQGIKAGTNIRGVRLDEGPVQDEESVNPGTDHRRFVTSFTLSVDYAVPC